MRGEGIHLMPVEITADEAKLYAAEREKEKELEKEQVSDWRIEIYKMIGTLIINVFVISVLILGVLYTSTDVSSRFMSLLEIVIGAIFGVTATQIAKE